MNIPNDTILEQVMCSIRQFPSNNAFCIRDCFYTYEQLGECIEQIRKTLHSTDFHSPYVGLLANDDIQTYASIFAIWAEHLAYVPLSPSWPEDRCKSILSQNGINIILESGKVVRTEIETSATMEVRSNDFDIATIIYTSGSTGIPKGVRISHQNIAANLACSTDVIGFILTERDHYINYFDMTFVGSIKGLFLPLIKGACCHTIPSDEIKYMYLGNMLEQYSFPYILTPFSVIRMLLPYKEELNLSQVKTWAVSTEPCDVEIARQWIEGTSLTLQNLYGATEVTGAISKYFISQTNTIKQYNGLASLGKPIAPATIKIVDETGKEVKPGQKGELCVLGPNITPDHSPIYHTGDLGFMDEDGDVFCCGRLNQMVKINGLRVEMGEIEHHASQYLDGKKVICMPFESSTGMAQIALFAESGPMDEDALLTYLGTKMPPYMIPAKVIFMESIPLTLSGKTDRQKLLSLL